MARGKIAKKSKIISSWKSRIFKGKWRTIKEFLEATGVNPKRFSEYLNETRNPSDSAFDAIEGVLKESGL